MRRAALLVLLAVPLAATGCQRFLVRTDNRVRIEGPVDTRVELVPVAQAGAVRPVIVQPGEPAARVAVIDVDGILLNTPFTGPYAVGENPVALFREKLDAAAADPCVTAVVLRINSPGGGMAASLAMRADLERFRATCGKPVVACLLDLGTGGAYYLASAADQIVVTPATVTGGIGVIINLFNLRDVMAQFNIIPQPIKAGENIDIGTSARALRDDERELLQAMADEFHQKLKMDIQQSRPGINRSAETFDGRIFTGSQAVARGLADRLGDLDAAIQLAAAMGRPECPSATPQVILYRRANDPAHSIYAVTANTPLQAAGLLLNIPGLERSRLPTFLSLWQPEMTMEKLGGK
jgi:protease-4